MIIRIAFILIVASLLAACSGTTVVLVPDANGKVGQVDITTKAGTTSLTSANESAEASQIDESPSAAAKLSDEKVRDMFGETLAKEPMPPEHFVFYFATASDKLLPESNETLEKAKSAIQVRNSCDLSVIGHSDTVGDNKLNEGISLARADSVIKALTNLGVDQTCMDKRYYGENDLAVHTADNVDEPRNRRVELEIR